MGHVPGVAAPAPVVEWPPELRPGAVRVGNRGFGASAHFALLILRAGHGVLRRPQKPMVAFPPARPPVPVGQGARRDHKGPPRSRWRNQIGQSAQIVDWRKPTVCPKGLSEPPLASLPESLTVREVRYRVTYSGTYRKHPCNRRLRPAG